MAWSKNQIDKLGKRLRDADQPSDEDLTGYQEMCSRYEEPLSLVIEVVQAQGLSMTSRFPKTAGTLTEKLKRDSSRLSQIQDIAGLRIVIDGDRNAQDQLARDLQSHLGDEVRCEVKDRRDDPSSGYRAVHIIAFVNGIPVEIQVRTKLQDLWANLMEKFADIYGRQVRYGGQPDRPDEPILGELTPRDLYANLMQYSDLVHRVETVRSEMKDRSVIDRYGVDRAIEMFDLTDQELDEGSLETVARQRFNEEMESLEQELADSLETLRTNLIRIEAGLRR